MGSEETPDRILNAIAEYTPRHVEHSEASPAAVLILVCDREGEPHVVFTERTTHVEHHKGQISLPDGACDESDESVETTADPYAASQPVRVEHLAISQPSASGRGWAESPWSLSFASLRSIADRDWNHLLPT